MPQKRSEPSPRRRIASLTRRRKGSSNGIYEDHPGLNPSSERIVELQSDIHEKLTELMPNKSAQDACGAN